MREKCMGREEIPNKEFKNQKEMVHIELLEAYSHYNRISLRSSEEQDYLALLRNEIFERIGNEDHH